MANCITNLEDPFFAEVMITRNICLDIPENFALPQFEEDEEGSFWQDVAALITATLTDLSNEEFCGYWMGRVGLITWRSSQQTRDLATCTVGVVTNVVECDMN
jgi:hypothetical protein